MRMPVPQITGGLDHRDHPGSEHRVAHRRDHQLEHEVITRILAHLARKGIEPGRGPPERLQSPLSKTA